MNRYCNRCALVFACLALTFAAIGRAATLVTIDDLDPADGSELAIGESLNVLIAYQTDETVTLWARPYRHGKEVKQAMSNPSEKYTGAGQALGWFALTGDGAIDEIRIIAGGGLPYRERLVGSQPVNITWGATGTRHARAGWVDELQNAANERSAERARQRASEPTSAGDTVLVGGFMLLVAGLLIASVALPVIGVVKWRGNWRIAAAAPLALMAFVVLRIVSDTTRDPTSHNLWPFEILMSGLAAIVAIGVLKLMRVFGGVRSKEQDQ